MHLILRTFEIKPPERLEARDQRAVYSPLISPLTSLSSFLTSLCLCFLIGERGWTMPIAGSYAVGIKALLKHLNQNFKGISSELHHQRHSSFITSVTSTA